VQELGTPLWRHDYGVVHSDRHVWHLMPASVIGDIVSVIPHPDALVPAGATTLYCSWTSARRGARALKSGAIVIKSD